MKKYLKIPSIQLIDSIGNPFNPHNLDNCIESLGIYECAIKNKVPLLYLESLQKQGKLENFQNELSQGHSDYYTLLRAIVKISNIFEEYGIDYIIFKTIKPYKAVPGDIDIIILGDDEMYELSVEALLRKGYSPQLDNIVDIEALTTNEDYKKAAKLLIKPTHGGSSHGMKHISPGGTDLIDLEFKISIDLQKELAMSHVIYLDKNNFKFRTVKENYNNVEVILPSPEIDLAILIAHSLVEQIYLLGEFYTFLYILNEMNDDDLKNFVDIIKENKLENATKSFITITTSLVKECFGEVHSKLEFLLNEFGSDEVERKRLIKNNFKMPHKYGSRTFMRFLTGKISETRFRNSVGVQLVRMLNPKLTILVLKSLVEMRKRESYLKTIDE